MKHRKSFIPKKLSTGSHVPVRFVLWFLDITKIAFLLGFSVTFLSFSEPNPKSSYKRILMAPPCRHVLEVLPLVLGLDPWSSLFITKPFLIIIVLSLTFSFEIVSKVIWRTSFLSLSKPVFALSHASSSG